MTIPLYKIMDDRSNTLVSPQSRTSPSGEAEPPSYDAHFPELSSGSTASTTFRDEKQRPEPSTGTDDEPFRPVEEQHRWRRNEYRPSYSLDAEHNITS